MASTIAAITTGIGGIVTTADATGNLSLLSGTSTVVAVTSAGAAVTGTMSVSGATTLAGGLNTPLAVTSGGTGLGTLTANNVILGAGTSNPTFVAPSTTGNLLTSNGTTWTSAAAPAGGVTTFNGSTTGLTPATATSGAITLGGTLAVANGGTGVTTSTGSGANVLGTSPTLTTPVINGFTGDTSVINIGSGQVYKDASGNVGIGTALPRRALSINGGLTFQAAGGASRSIHWGDETTNIFPITIAGNAISGSESLTFQTNVFGSAGTERMRIDSSGNVGVGTSSPSTFGKFAVVGGNAYADGGYFAKNSSSTADTILKMPLSISTLILRPNGDNTVEFFNDVYGSALTIQQTNVGIGTSSPSSKLTVNANPPASGAISAVAATTNGISLALSDNVTNSLYVSHLAGGASFGTDGGGSLQFCTNGRTSVNMAITAAGALSFNSGYGSAATAYGCRAWVNFNGTGTVAIRGSGNVSSITDNGTGDYTVNFTTAMVDANYAVICGPIDWRTLGPADATTVYINTTFVRLINRLPNNATQVDNDLMSVAIFR